MPPAIPDRDRAPVIIHPTDFSPEAEAAEAEAVRLARVLGAEVVLVHVSVEAVLYGENPFGMDELEKLYLAQARWAEAALAERARCLTAEGVKARWRRATGTPHEEIVGIAANEGAAYIVMSTHGRGGFQRLMMGSVADRVLRTAPCPVLTVRPHDDRRETRA